MKYNLFIGRYQSPHKGHMQIFDSYLKKNLPVLIAIRDVQINEENPLSANKVQTLWEKIYAKNPLVKVIIIPDILSVNYGREVGYEVNKIDTGELISSISASLIRKQILEGNAEWKKHVDESIHEMLVDFIK